MNVTDHRETVSLIFLGMEESFFEAKTLNDERKKYVIPSAIEQFESLIKKVKTAADIEIKIVITSSWGKKAENFEDLQTQLQAFSFKDRVIDAVSFRHSDDSVMKEAEKIRQWLLNNHEKWNIKSILAVGSFQACEQVRHRFPTVPILFNNLGIEGILETTYGFAFSHLDIEPSYQNLTTKSFSIDSLASWEPIQDCVHM